MKNQNLQRWALIAEIIGGIAVVLTLIFLIQETQDNTNAIKAQTYQMLTSDFNEVRRDMYSADLAETRVKWIENGYESLSRVERSRLAINAQALWAVYESAYFSYQRGTLGEDEWERYIIGTCRNRRGMDDLWETESGPEISRNLTPQFRDYVEELCR